MRSIKLFIVLFFPFILTQVSGLKRVCYFTNWSQYRRYPATFNPEHIDPHLCSHLVYAFANMVGNRLVPAEWNDDPGWGTGLYERFNNIKQRNPDLQTLLAVGGWSFGTYRMTTMLATYSSRATFVTSTIEYLREKNFDGLDLDFEYPGSRGSPSQDKYRFTMLCKELRAAFQAESLATGRQRLLLTAAVPAGKWTIDSGYEIAQLAEYLDFINLMSYDLHGSWERKTGLVAPLYPQSSEYGAERYLNVEWVVNYWLAGGVPKEKVVVGIPTYGRGYTLANANQNYVGAPAAGASRAGTYTKEAGVLAYYEICDIMKQQGVTRGRSEEQRGAYIAYENQWIGFDDRESMTLKVNWLKEKGLGGWMIWSLDYDDFNGVFCGQGRYPLLQALNAASRSTNTPSSVPPTSTKTTTTVATTSTTVPTTTTTTTSSTTTTKAAAADISDFCRSRSNGVYANPASCRSSLHCSWGRTFEMACPGLLVFDSRIMVCNWPWSVPQPCGFGL